MTGAYVDKNYVYAVARIRSAELKLLNRSQLDELLAAENAEAVYSLLKEKGWGTESCRTWEDMLKSEEKKLWELIEELVPDMSVFDVFKKPGDYHNLKAAIKEAAEETEIPGIYTSESTIDPERIRLAVRERNFGMLPPEMAEAAGEINDSYLRTKDGQLCDTAVDRICLEEMVRAGEASDCGFLSQYALLMAAAAVIKTAVRSARTGKSRDFLNQAIADIPTLDRNALIQAAMNGEEQIIAYLLTTDYADAVPAIRKGMTAFENYCDDLITRRMKDQQRESFGLGPIAAYILARKNEMKSVRIIFSGKENGFSDDMIRERVRETYV